MANVSRKVLGIAIFFAVLPLLISGYYFYIGTQSLTSFTITGFDHLINGSADYSDEFIAFFTEEFVKQRALLTSKNMQYHLLVNYPGDGLEDLLDDTSVRQIALSGVGRQGYTSIHSREGVVLFHPDPTLVGVDLSTFASQLPDYWELVQGSLEEDVEGRYDWRDLDGEIQPYYMYCTPVDTYVSCAHIPLAELEETGNYLAGLIEADKEDTVAAIEKGLWFLQWQLMIILLVLLATAVISIVLLVRKTITNPAKKLILFVSKITTGNYDYPHGIKSKDEFGRLAYTIHGLAQVLKKYKQGSPSGSDSDGDSGDSDDGDDDEALENESQGEVSQGSTSKENTPPRIVVRRKKVRKGDLSAQTAKGVAGKVEQKKQESAQESPKAKLAAPKKEQSTPQSPSAQPETATTSSEFPMVKVGHRTRREYL